MKILITGISSWLGRQVATTLLREGHDVIGIDRRPWPDSPQSVRVWSTDIRKRPAEEVFRSERPEAVIHLATSASFGRQTEMRHRMNLEGTRRILQACADWGVTNFIFVGRHTIYGADADSPLYHREDEPPLGGSTFPELADHVAADLYAGSALWRYPELRTCVLRLVYTLGPSRRGTLARFVSGPRVPTLLGYDPLFQFMHDEDAVTAIAAALNKQLRGVFNVAGPQPLPLSVLIRRAGSVPVPMPAAAISAVQGRLGFSKLAGGAARHLRYPIVIDGSAFAEATGWRHRFDELQCVDAFRASDEDFAY